SVVYRGLHRDRPVAVKVQKRAEGGDTDPLSALEFRKEAAALARIHHRGLAEIMEVGEVDGRPYLVMELVEGRNLRSLIRDGSLSEEEIVEVAKTVAEVLAVVHRHG